MTFFLIDYCSELLNVFIDGKLYRKLQACKIILIYQFTF